MSVINTYNIQPNEYKRYKLGYSAWLNSVTGDKLSTCAVHVRCINLDEPDPVLNSAISQITDDGTSVEYIVDGGTDGGYYILTFDVITVNDAADPKFTGISGSHQIQFRVRQL